MCGTHHHMHLLNRDIGDRNWLYFTRQGVWQNPVSMGQTIATECKDRSDKQCQLTCQLAKGGSFSPTSSFFSDRVIFRAATSTSNTLPDTFCPSLYFARAFSDPLSDMCTVGTSALQMKSHQITYILSIMNSPYKCCDLPVTCIFYASKLM